LIFHDYYFFAVGQAANSQFGETLPTNVLPSGHILASIGHIRVPPAVVAAFVGIIVGIEDILGDEVIGGDATGRMICKVGFGVTWTKGLCPGGVVGFP
jgi:hypothetical protein